MAGSRPPNLRRDPRNRNWLYRRTIPPELRPRLGGKREIVRSLGISHDRFSSREFKASYQSAHLEAERLLSSAEEVPTVALTDRDRFGLMRELLLAYEMTDQVTLVEKSNRALQPKPDETAESWIQRQAQADASIDVLLLNEVVRRLRMRSV